MEKIWYIVINDKDEGPYSFLELLSDKRITPETFAWREGFKNWTPIKDIPELKEIVDKPRPKKPEKKEKSLLPATDEIVIDYRGDPSFPFLWIIIALLIILFTLYKIYWLQ